MGDPKGGGSSVSISSLDGLLLGSSGGMSDDLVRGLGGFRATDGLCPFLVDTSGDGWGEGVGEGEFLLCIDGDS